MQHFNTEPVMSPKSETQIRPGQTQTGSDQSNRSLGVDRDVRLHLLGHVGDDGFGSGLKDQFLFDERRHGV